MQTFCTVFRGVTISVFVFMDRLPVDAAHTPSGPCGLETVPRGCTWETRSREGWALGHSPGPRHPLQGVGGRVAH